MVRIGVIYGSRSVEHEISVLTAHQVMAALSADTYQIVPIYISKSGQWYTGDVLRDLHNYSDLDVMIERAVPVIFSSDATRQGLIPTQSEARSGFSLFGGRRESLPLIPLDVVFPLLHGSHGEDGTVQGLCELADIPYAGPGVAAAAVGMDKVLAKRVMMAVGLPLVDYVEVGRRQWQATPEEIIRSVEDRFSYPLFVKPVSLGSSIGVSRVDSTEGLRFALDVATTYDSRIMVEVAQENIIEVNCSVLGQGDDLRVSACEQPIGGAVLSYEDKYVSGGKSRGMEGTKRIIPAPISSELESAIQEAAKSAFMAIGAAGVARVDFLVRPETNDFYVNEINTIPGSLAFYLWEPVGLPFGELVETLIRLGQERHADKNKSTYTFDTPVLATSALTGAKTGSAKLSS